MLNNELQLIVRGLLNIDEVQHQLEWEEFREGVEIHRLYQEKDQGPAAALLRYRAGARVPLHLHVGFEHILVLSGSQSDGEKVFESGSLVISAPGSKHQIFSENGCIVLAIWQKPVEFT